MSIPILLTPDAETDIADARSWYESKGVGLGDQFVLNIEAALDRIKLIPRGGKEVEPGVRRAGVRRFPYGVFYRIDPDQIAIFAVYHSKRNPRTWRARHSS